MTLLGYWLGQYALVQKLIEPIFIAIVLISVLPMAWEAYTRRRDNHNVGDTVGPDAHTDHRSL